MLIASVLDFLVWEKKTAAAIRRGLGLPPTWDDLRCWDCPAAEVELDERGEPVRVWWLEE